MQRIPMPGWQAIRLAEAPEISHFSLLYDPEVVEPLRIGAGLPNLRRIGFLSERTTLPFAFGARTPRWQEFGLIGGRKASEMAIGRLEFGTLAWVFLFEWHPQRSAWEAFLAAQDALQPQLMSLSPDLLLPCLFLTRMAAFPLVPGATNYHASWVPCFAAAHSRLSPLLISFFVAWLRGTSKAAARYRAATGPAPEYTREQREAQALWKEVFGLELLQTLRTTERIEPAIIRGLEAASHQLWTNHTLRVPPKALPLVSGLLPLACWQPQPVVPLALDSGAWSSLEKLTQRWKTSRGQTPP